MNVLWILKYFCELVTLRHDLWRKFIWINKFFMGMLINNNALQLFVSSLEALVMRSINLFENFSFNIFGILRLIFATFCKLIMIKIL